jgi:transcriptional regulator with XRE-family HTH domain
VCTGTQISCAKGQGAAGDQSSVETSLQPTDIRPTIVLDTYIAICDKHIAYCNMTLGEKIRHLRTVEGNLRGLERALTQAEVVELVRRELRKKISQSYLSQIESGARPHLTQATRQLLARFFKVHPGFLLDDIPGFQTGLGSELRIEDAKIDSLLYAAAENFPDDPEFGRTLQVIADYSDTRKSLLLLGEILKVPGLADHLYDVLKTGPSAPARA